VGAAGSEWRQTTAVLNTVTNIPVPKKKKKKKKKYGQFY
jgi:hypothetical protein